MSARGHARLLGFMRLLLACGSAPPCTMCRTDRRRSLRQPEEGSSARNKTNRCRPAERPGGRFFAPAKENACPRPQAGVFSRSFSQEISYGRPASEPDREEGVISLPGVYLEESDNFDISLRRFKKQVEKAGILSELKKRQHYEKPSVMRKKKKAAARKRLLKKMRKINQM